MFEILHPMGEFPLAYGTEVKDVQDKILAECAKGGGFVDVVLYSHETVHLYVSPSIPMVIRKLE